MQNTRYIVTSGARQKEEDWDPEENGGFAVHGVYTVNAPFQTYSFLCLLSETDPNAGGPVDPLAALEKSTNAQNYVNQVQVPRLEALQSLSDHYGTDPYALSRNVRKRFREVKKVEKAKQESDDKLKSAYGLPETLALTADDEESRAEARELWQEEKQRAEAKRRKLGHDATVPSRVGRPSSSVRVAPLSKVRESSASSSAVLSLRARILANTAQRSRPPANSSGKLKPPDIKASIIRR